MAYKTELQNNNTDLQSVLEKVRGLPEAGRAFVPVSVIADSQSINVTYTGKNGVETTKMDVGVEINVEVVANSLLLGDRSGLSPMYGGICEGSIAVIKTIEDNFMGEPYAYVYDVGSEGGKLIF